MPKIIFDMPFDMPLFRSSDPDTSRQIKSISINSHRGILLAIYAGNISGLTDEEAASIAASRGHTINGYWKRCADLRNQGLIQDLGIRRELSTGSQGMVCAITRFGLDIATGCYD
tara:strand:- start:246 stop:590 length:345 start_codon:yes stop_codon:yes gene_type:complete